MHAGPIGALDRSAPDPLGHSGGGARGWPRRDDTLGGDDGPGAVRCRVRDGDVGQVAPGQRPRDSEPGRLRLRRGRLVPAHRRRGPVDDAVVLPERGRDLQAVCRQHEDQGRAADDLLEEEGREARGGQRLRRGVEGGVRSQDHRVGDRLHAEVEGRGQTVLLLPALRAGAQPVDPRPGVRRQDEARELRRHPHRDGRLHRRDPRQARRARARRGHDRRLGVGQRPRPGVPHPDDRPGPGGRHVERVLRAVAGRPVHIPRGVEPDALHHPLAGEGARREGQQRDRARGGLVPDAAQRPPARRCPTTG